MSYIFDPILGKWRKKDKGGSWLTPAQENAIKWTYPVALNPFKINDEWTGIAIDGEVFSLLNGNFWYDVPEFTGGIPAFPDNDIQSWYLRIWALWTIEWNNWPEYVFTVGDEYDTSALVPPLSAGEWPWPWSVLQTRGIVLNFDVSTQPMNAGYDNGIFVEQIIMNWEPITISGNPVIYFDGTDFLTKKDVFVNQFTDIYNYGKWEPIKFDLIDWLTIPDWIDFLLYVTISIDAIYVTANPVQWQACIAYIDIRNNSWWDFVIDSNDLSNFNTPGIDFQILSLIPWDYLWEWTWESEINSSRILFQDGNVAVLWSDFYRYEGWTREPIGWWWWWWQRNDVYLSDVTNADSNEFDNFADAYASKSPYGYLPYTIRAKPNIAWWWQRLVVDTGVEHDNQNTTFQSYLSNDNVSWVTYIVSNTNSLTQFSLPKKMNNVNFIMADDAGTRLWDTYNYPVELDMINSTIEQAWASALYEFDASVTINMRGISSLKGNTELFMIWSNGSLKINAYDAAEIDNILNINTIDPEQIIINVFSNKVKLHEDLKNNINCTINFLWDFYTQRISWKTNDANKTDTIDTATYDNATGILTIEPTSWWAGQYSVWDRINITNLVMDNWTIYVDYAPVVDVLFGEVSVQLTSWQNYGAYVSWWDILRNTVLSIANNQLETISAELSYTTLAWWWENKKVSIIMRDTFWNIAILYDWDTITWNRDMFVKAKMWYDSLSNTVYQSQLEVDWASSVSTWIYGNSLNWLEILLVLDCDVVNQITINNLTLTN